MRFRRRWWWWLLAALYVGAVLTLMPEIEQLVSPFPIHVPRGFQ